MIILIRHGETVLNREGRKQGRSDSGLTAKERSQAKMIGVALASSELLDGDFRIVCSPLGRTRSTAELVCVHAGIAADMLEYEDLLMEPDHGDWEGMTAE